MRNLLAGLAALVILFRRRGRLPQGWYFRRHPAGRARPLRLPLRGGRRQRSAPTWWTLLRSARTKLSSGKQEEEPTAKQTKEEKDR